MGNAQSSQISSGYAEALARNSLTQFNTIMARADKPEIPSDKADVTIIGSGIAAAAVAYSVLAEYKRINKPRRVLVIEARDLCAGATGRGNGLLNCAPHEVFHRLRASIGLNRAAALVRFQLANIKVLDELCRKMKWDIAEYRDVDHVEFYFSDRDRELAFRKVKLLSQWVPEFEIATYSEQQAQSRFKTSRSVKGAISYDAAVIWPFGFVTSVWNYLLREYKDSLYLMTNTRVNSIETLGRDGHGYIVRTTRGKFRCNHLVHATNAFAPNLVPGLRNKMTGILGTATALRPGNSFNNSDMDHGQSWSIAHGKTCDYAMQRPIGLDGPKDIIVSGGFSHATGHGTSMIGGRETDSPSGRVIETWSGVLSATGDILPFVGHLDPSLTGRSPKPRRNKTKKYDYKYHGEWITAGFGGDGLTWAWLSGIALGAMIVGTENFDVKQETGRPGGTVAKWFPKELIPTLERFDERTFGDIALRFVWSILGNQPEGSDDDDHSADSIHQANVDNVML
ncbi:DAO-domain-containing protein [Daldinia eschscholtzii]|nr:DAO-domain-containing protein [Daldinia eschscholtzii]